MSRAVLLVEDEYDTRELLGRAIERAGYRCSTADGLAAALERARAPEGIDVVVTDVVLGADDRGGLTLMTELRTLGIRAPVVVITAFADVEKVKTALNSGAAHFLEKPFRAAELVRVLARICPSGDDEPARSAAEAAPDASQAAERVFLRARLTEKESVVARHLLDGLSGTEIADLLGNSPKTIRQHVSQIYAKCGVGSRAELFRLVYLG